MKKILIALLLLASGLIAQDGKFNWYKGNLHTHSLWSDGDAFPEMVIDWYKKSGYHFIALSDHNILADHDKRVTLKEDDNAWLDYLKNFGSRIDAVSDTGYVSVRLKTLDEYRPLFEEEGKFLILKSEEISDRFEKKPVHINANNIRELIKPQGGSTLLEVMQNNIDAVNEQRKRTGQPMFPHVNHPNFGWAITAKEITELEGDKFFEVYNGHPLVNNYGDSLRPSTEEMWDMILTARLRGGKDVLYGLAVDDAHNYLSEGIKHANPGRGWVMVRASALTPESLIAAMEKGDFYSSIGVVLEKLEVNDKRIRLAVKPEAGVSFAIRFIGCLKDGNEAMLLSEYQGNEAEYKFSGNELYVRGVVVSSKLKANPYKEWEYETAWVQPVAVR